MSDNIFQGGGYLNIWNSILKKLKTTDKFYDHDNEAKRLLTSYTLLPACSLNAQVKSRYAHV